MFYSACFSTCVLWTYLCVLKCKYVPTIKVISDPECGLRLFFSFLISLLFYILLYFKYTVKLWIISNGNNMFIRRKETTDIYVILVMDESLFLFETSVKSPSWCRVRMTQISIKPGLKWIYINRNMESVSICF